MGCFIIAEAGVNHNGDLRLAEELVHAAKESGADAVKFQSFKADYLVNKTASQADYQKKNSLYSSQYEMLKALELSEEAHVSLTTLAKALGIEFMSTGFDEDSVQFLIALGVRRLKIPSGEITNLSFLKALAETRLPLILSTGMSSLSEVRTAVDIIRPFYKDNLNTNLILLHCTSNYPAAYEDVNLLAMQTLAKVFGLPVGYSDHTLGCLVPIMAIALGAVVIEKHFTLDNTLKGPDHAASMNPEAFATLVKSIRDADLALGNPSKQPTKTELPIRDLVRRSITLKHALPQGQPLAKEDLILLRPGNGIQPAQLEELIGKRLRQNLAAGSTLLWDHIEP